MTSTEPTRKIVITGGAGYIGSILTAELLAYGYAVTVIDNLMYDGRSLLGYLSHPQFSFIRGDITNESDVERAVQGADAVVHLAAIVGDPACARNPELAVAVNRDGARKVYHAAVHHGVERFLFASTCSNYGRMDSSDGWVDEDSPLKPISHYAELKVEFEQFLLQESHDLTPVCLRFATAFGMSQRPRFDLTVNQFTAELVQGRPLEVYGEQFWRPYCHIGDLARACRLALEADTEIVGKKAFNVGADSQNHTKKQLLDMIVEHAAVSRSLIKSVERNEDPRDYRVRCTHISSALGFSPTRPVIEGIMEIAHAVRTGIITDTHDVRYQN